MSTWDQYRLTMEPTARERRNAQIVADWPRTWTTELYMKHAARFVESNDNINVQQCYLMEAAYVAEGRPILFCGSSDLALALHRSKLEIDFDLLMQCSIDVLSVAWPTNLLVEGIRPRPVLIYFHRGPGYTTSLHLSYRTGFMACGGFHAQNQERLDFCLNSGMDNVEVVGDFMDPVSVPRVVDEMMLSARLATALVIYSMSEGAFVHNGVPDRMVARDRRNILSANKMCRTADVPAELRGTPSIHWRRWHFRALRDGRFKRNTDGSVRMTFVRGTVVGRCKPVTVEK